MCYSKRLIIKNYTAVHLTQKPEEKKLERKNENFIKYHAQNRNALLSFEAHASFLMIFLY